MSIHKIRGSLILILFGVGLIMNIKFGFSPAWYFYLTALILLITHFLFANVWTAFSQLRKGNAMEAELMLSQVRKPNWLAKSPRAYYYFTKGMIELQKKNLKIAEEDLQTAFDLGLRTETDKALISLNLAHICLVKNRRTEAKNFLEQAKSFKTNDLMLKDNIRKMEGSV